MNVKLRGLVVLIILLAISSLACNAISGLTGGNEPSADNGVTTEATAESGNVGTTSNDAGANNGASDEADDSADTAAPTEGPETLDFTSLGSAIEGADTYRLTLEMSFESSDASETGRIFANVSQSNDPMASKTTITAEGSDPNLAELSGFSLTQIENTVYTELAGLGCFASDVGSALGGAVEANPFGDLLESDELVGNVAGARRVLPDETINGVDTYHFVFDDTAFDNSATNDLRDVDGHMYVDKESLSLVRLTMAGVGTADFFGNGVTEGNVYIEINVLDINQPVTISPPDDCTGGFDPGNIGGLGGDTGDDELYPLGSDYPVFPENHDLFVADDITSYQTEAEFDDLVSFYQEQMIDAGYAVVEDGTVLTTDAAVMKYSKDGQTYFVTISQSGDTVFVQIVPES